MSSVLLVMRCSQEKPLTVALPTRGGNIGFMNTLQDKRQGNLTDQNTTELWLLICTDHSSAVIHCIPVGFEGLRPSVSKVGQCEVGETASE